LIRIGDQTGDGIHQKVDEGTITGVFKAKDIFQLIIDGLDETAFSEN
jgi:hypothetical protein